MDLQAIIKRIRCALLKKTGASLPLTGYTEHRNTTKFIDGLSDGDLVRLNHLLHWQCFTVDRHGRRFGNAAWEGKRSEPQIIPDKRIVLMHDTFNLTDKHVLEVGCFEGIHTIGLSQYAKNVTAVDSRIENVVKTIVRCAFFGYHPTVFQCNLEEGPVNVRFLSCDIIHHVGVLYHLRNPVQHLLGLGKYVRLGVMLDTHYALPNEAIENDEINGIRYQYKKYNEGSDVFSGMYDYARWLTLDDIVAFLKTTGFKQVEILEKRSERNGPRVLLIAKKEEGVPLEGHIK